MNLKSIATSIFSFIWLFVSIKQWAFDYPDISSLLFSIGFFFIGLFVSYSIWFNGTVDERNKDIQAIDNKLNRLEIKVIELNGK